MAITEGVRPRRLIAVDDSPEVLALLGDALRVDGTEIALFDGRVTLQDIESSHPDLLLIDLRLGAGGLTGLDMIRRVRSHRELRHIPIIVCSAALDAIAEHDEELERIPNLSILRMPFSLDDLEACVDAALSE